MLAGLEIYVTKVNNMYNVSYEKKHDLHVLLSFQGYGPNSVRPRALSSLLSSLTYTCSRCTLWQTLLSHLAMQLSGASVIDAACATCFSIDISNSTDQYLISSACCNGDISLAL